MSETTKGTGAASIEAVFPGPNVGPDALAGTLHPQLGALTPGRHTFPARKAAIVEAAIDAGLLARAPGRMPAPAKGATTSSHPAATAATKEKE